MKRTHREIRKSLFKVLSDGKKHSYGDLERKVNTNWRTIRDHLEYMKLFGAIEIKDKKIIITKFGKKIFRSL